MRFPANRKKGRFAVTPMFRKNVMFVDAATVTQVVYARKQLTQE